MAMNDLATLDGKIHRRPRRRRHLVPTPPPACGTLREILCLFDANDEPEVQKLIEGLVDVRPQALLRRGAQAFRRARADRGGAEASLVGRAALKDVRDRTFHYPKAGGMELRETLEGAASLQARYLDEGPRPFKYADNVAVRISFGDIDDEEDRKRFVEVIETNKQILQSLIPVVWNASGLRPRSRVRPPPARGRRGRGRRGRGRWRRGRS